MSTLFLPIHPRMDLSKLVGAIIINNAGGGLQGQEGKIVRSTASSTHVEYTSGRRSRYITSFFFKRFYVSVFSLETTMQHDFNYAGFVDKYKSYVLPKNVLVKKCISHAEMKEQVDSKLKEKPVSQCETKQEYVDETGHYLVISKGEIVGTPHKTQRLAEIAASKHVKEKRCRAAVLKVVAEINPICEAEVIRL